MIANAAMLAALEPGELLVRVLCDGWTIPPDHTAIARANRALRNFGVDPGTYRGHAPDARQTACLEGGAA